MSHCFPYFFSPFTFIRSHFRFEYVSFRPEVTCVFLLQISFPVTFMRNRKYITVALSISVFDNNQFDTSGSKISVSFESNTRFCSTFLASLSFIRNQYATSGMKVSLFDRKRFLLYFCAVPLIIKTRSRSLPV